MESVDQSVVSLVMGVAGLAEATRAFASGEAPESAGLSEMRSLLEAVAEQLTELEGRIEHEIPLDVPDAPLPKGEVVDSLSEVFDDLGFGD